MFDLGAWGEFLLIAVVALILLGPKDIPKVLKIVGHWVYKIRALVQGVRNYVDELAFQAQREDILRSNQPYEDSEDEKSNDNRG